MCGASRGCVRSSEKCPYKNWPTARWNRVHSPSSSAYDTMTGLLVAATRDDRPDRPLAQVASGGAAAVALVPGDAVGPEAGPPATGALDGARFQERRQRQLLVALAAGQGEDERPAAPLGADVDLGREAAPTPAERLGGRSPLAPAACWWARTMEPSTKCRLQSRPPAASPARWSAARTWSKTPARCQRRKRL